MARFKNSNRIATEQMMQTTRRRYRRAPQPDRKQTYFERIGFDFAMI